MGKQLTQGRGRDGFDDQALAFPVDGDLGDSELELARNPHGLAASVAKQPGMANIVSGHEATPSQTK